MWNSEFVRLFELLIILYLNNGLLFKFDIEKMEYVIVKWIGIICLYIIKVIVGVFILFFLFWYEYNIEMIWLLCLLVFYLFLRNFVFIIICLFI